MLSEIDGTNKNATSLEAKSFTSIAERDQIPKGIIGLMIKKEDNLVEDQKWHKNVFDNEEESALTHTESISKPCKGNHNNDEQLTDTEKELKILTKTFFDNTTIDKTRISKLEKEKVALEDKAKSLELDIENVTEEMGKERVEVTELQSQVKAILLEKNSVYCALDELKAEAALLKFRLGNMTAEKNHADEQILDLTTGNEDKSKVIEKLVTENEGINKAMKELEKSLQKTLSEKDSNINCLSRQYQESQSSIIALNATNTRLKSCLDDLLVKLESSQSQISELRNQNFSMKTEMEMLEVTIKQLELKNTSLSEESKSRKDQVNSLQSHVDDVVSDNISSVDSLKDIISALEANLLDANTENKGLAKELYELTESYEDKNRTIEHASKKKNRIGSASNDGEEKQKQNFHEKQSVLSHNESLSPQLEASLADNGQTTGNSESENMPDSQRVATNKEMSFDPVSEVSRLQAEEKLEYSINSLTEEIQRNQDQFQELSDAIVRMEAIRNAAEILSNEMHEIYEEDQGKTNSEYHLQPTSFGEEFKYKNIRQTSQWPPWEIFFQIKLRRK